MLIVHLGVSWQAALAWAAVASTDFLDGWVARRQGATTSGAFLDPLADKVLVLGALGALAATGLASWLPVLIIAGREVTISVYRSVVGRNGISVPARPLAKCKTAAQDLAVGFILLPATGLHHPGIGQIAAVDLRRSGRGERRPVPPRQPASDARRPIANLTAPTLDGVHRPLLLGLWLEPTKPLRTDSEAGRTSRLSLSLTR